MFYMAYIGMIIILYESKIYSDYTHDEPLLCLRTHTHIYINVNMKFLHGTFFVPQKKYRNIYRLKNE